MPKIRLAICDANTCYAERLVSYLASHKREEAEIYAYTNPQLLLKKLQENAIQVVLLGEEFIDLLERLEAENIPVIVLLEQRIKNAAFVKEDVDEERCSFNCQTLFLPRYQPMETLWRRICVLVAAESFGGGTTQFLSTVQVVGICAAGGHEMQLFFSLLYTELLAKENKVLYLNFLSYVDFRELFGREDAYNMSDFILALRGHDLTPEKLQEYICEMDGISYIAPFCNPENIREVTISDYLEMLRVVRTYTDYEILVVDFGIGMEEFVKMLDCCHRIFCLTREGFFYQCQLKQFQEYVKSGMPELEKRLEIVNLPFQAKWIHGGGNLMEQLKWSEFGDFVRRNFSGESECVT